MILKILLATIMIVFLLCSISITLSDTETFKAIDRKIADRIERK